MDLGGAVASHLNGINGGHIRAVQADVVVAEESLEALEEELEHASEEFKGRALVSSREKVCEQWCSLFLFQ